MSWQLNEIIDDLRVKNGSLGLQLDASQALLAEANEHRHELQTANIDLRKQLAEAREREAGMTQMYEELYDHHFREHHTPDYQRIEDLERQLAEAKEREGVDSVRIHLFDEEVYGLRTQLSEARVEVERFKYMAEQNSSEMCEWQEKYSEARTEVDRLNTVINKARNISNWRGEG